MFSFLILRVVLCSPFSVNLFDVHASHIPYAGTQKNLKVVEIIFFLAQRLVIAHCIALEQKSHVLPYYQISVKCYKNIVSIYAVCAYFGLILHALLWDRCN